MLMLYNLRMTDVITYEHQNKDLLQKECVQCCLSTENPNSVSV